MVIAGSQCIESPAHAPVDGYETTYNVNHFIDLVSDAFRAFRATRRRIFAVASRRMSPHATGEKRASSGRRDCPRNGKNQSRLLGKVRHRTARVELHMIWNMPVQPVPAIQTCTQTVGIKAS